MSNPNTFKAVPCVYADGTHDPYPPLVDLEDTMEATEATFPVESLPGPVREYVERLSAQERTPVCLAACCALGVLSASLGSALQVQSGPERTSRGNLFILVGALSGTGKSSVFQKVAAPLMRKEQQELDNWEAAVMPGLMVEKRSAELRLKRLEGDAKKAQPSKQAEAEMQECYKLLQRIDKRLNMRPVLNVSDVTSQQLAIMLQNPSESLASMSPDGRDAVDNTLGRYNENGKEDGDLLLKCWSGDPVRVDRVGRAAVALRSPCLTALWLVQPDKVMSLFENRTMSESGLLPRFLFCQANAELRKISEGSNLPIPEKVAAGWFTLVENLLSAFRLYLGPQTWEDEKVPEPVTIIAEEAATQAIINYHDEVVELRRCGKLEGIGHFASRWAEHVWRLAVVLHAAQHGDTIHPEIDRIAGTGNEVRNRVAGARLSLAIAEDAIRLARWFVGQQLTLLEADRRERRADQLAKLSGLLAKNPAGIEARDLIAARIAPDAVSAKALLELLCAQGQLTCIEAPSSRKGKGARRVYRRVPIPSEMPMLMAA